MFDPRTRKRTRRRRQKIETKKTRKGRSWFIISLALISWSVLFFFIIFVDPELLKDVLIPDIYLPFFVVLATALALTFYVIFYNLRRTLTLTFAIIIFSFLRLYNQGDLLNFTLLVGLTISIEYYFYLPQKDSPNPPPPEEKKEKT